MAHFLVSIALVSAAYVLVRRVEVLINPGDAYEIRDKPLRWVLFVMTCAVLFLGTVVTGAGPHSGAEQATRLGISVRRATQMHSISVWVMVFVALVLTLRARKSSARWNREGTTMMRLMAALCAQGFIGYVQYFAGVPAPLVAVHVALSVIVWLCAFAVFLPASTLLVLD
jgi:cytochrome c oxidase assembly protein subunit 15